MANEATICNLALSHLGERANIASLTESSTEARLCATFYPLARDMALEDDWSFNSTRILLAEVANSWPQWRHAYAVPAKALRVLMVLPKDAPDDYAQLQAARFRGISHRAMVPFGYDERRREYKIELDEDGKKIIFSNIPNAMARYTVRVTDTNVFSATFTMALSQLLASMLAGPIIKGQAGAQMAQQKLALYEAMAAKAQADDANQERIHVEHIPASLAARL